MRADDLTRRLELAKKAAEVAGGVAMTYFRRHDLTVESKDDRSPVTEADRAAERAVRALLEKEVADDAIIGEEWGAKAGTSGFEWVLDPIDGTVSFIHGVPLFGTLIGLQFEGVSVAGVIDMPALKETLWAAKGSGAWLARQGEAPRQVRVSTERQLSSALVCTTSADYFRKSGRLPAHARLIEAAGASRGWSDCYAFFLVATGQADAAVEPIMNLWDAVALQPIIEEAGGRFTNWLGEPRSDGGDAVASNGLVHDQLMHILNQGPDDQL